MLYLFGSILLPLLYFTEASLTWPQVFHFKATMKIPSANVVEPYEVWSNGAYSHHRFDFYKGMSQMYQKRHEEINNVIQFRYYWISPDSTNANEITMVCRQLNVTSSEVQRLNYYLPPMYNFEEAGSDENHTRKWEYQYRDQEYGVVYKYALWTTGNTIDWVPVRYEYRMFNKGIESDFIRHDYETFSRTQPDSIVYEIPKRVCVVTSVEQILLFLTLEKDRMDLRCSPIPAVTLQINNETLLDLESQILQHNMTDLFESFKDGYNKQYKNNEEHSQRFTVFQNIIGYIQSMNSQHLSYKLAVNQLADLAEDELSLLSGTKIKPELTNTSIFLDNDENIENSQDFDWRLYGAVSSVKDQTVLCGCCYALATAAVIESAAYISKGCKDLEEVSEQALMDCSRGQSGYVNQGCDGGYLSYSLNWVKKNGIPLRNDYGPYLAMEGYCHLNQSRLVHIYNYVRLPTNIQAIKAALRRNGPLATLMYVPRSLFYYSSGIYDDKTCSSTPGDQTHAVVVVGYGKEKGKRYWLIKNSWGRQWGEKGYLKLDMEGNLCGITNFIYAIVDPATRVKQCKKSY